MLKTQFRKFGSEYRLIERKGCVAILEVTYPNISEDKVVGCDVCLIKFRGENAIDGRTINADEAYPSSSEWGKKGFSYQTYDTAKGKFDELVEKHGTESPVYIPERRGE